MPRKCFFETVTKHFFLSAFVSWQQNLTKKSSSQEKKLRRENNCFVAMSRKKILIRNYSCGSTFWTSLEISRKKTALVKFVKNQVKKKRQPTRQVNFTRFGSIRPRNSTVKRFSIAILLAFIIQVWLSLYIFNNF